MAVNGTRFEFGAAPRIGALGDVLIVPLASAPRPARALMRGVDALCDDAVSRLVEVGAVTEEVGQLAHSVAGGSFARVLVASLGHLDKLDAEGLRTVGGKIGGWLVAQRIPSATLWLGGLTPCTVENAVGEVLLGMMLSGFRFSEYRAPDARTPARVRVALRARESASVGAALVASRDAGLIADAVATCKRLGHLPPNALHPGSLPDEARKLARAAKLKCEVLNAAALRKLGMNGLLSVGVGSQHPPCLIRLEYRGAPRAGTQVVLVGKTITFDTGGYSIKPADGLEKMKFDMCGGATVLAVMQAAAAGKLKCNLVGLLAVAENAVSSRAYKPGDILRMASGKTVEITNTDAEGRLVLADALWYAQQHCKPTALIDLATLTGGAVLALGREAACLMANNDELAGALGESGRRTRERLWRLPLWDEYRELIKGQDADIRNSATKRQALTIVGGIFLKEFVRDTTPWAHIDIAATAMDESSRATGFGVRLLIDFLRHRT